MKQKLPFMLLALAIGSLSANEAYAQDVKASNITSLSAEKKAEAVNVTLTGSLTSARNGDFRQLRDLCWQMRSLNLTSANCTAIPDNALHSRHHLRELKLPTKLLTIGSQAFFACDSLQGPLNIPSKVTSIGPSAFNGCSSISSLVLPNNLVNIGSYAFAGCSSLSGKVILPTALRSLRDGVFSGCSAIQTVNLPADLQSIGANAFSDCTALEGDLDMGRMLTRIGASAFAGCTSLKQVNLPRALQQVGECAFAGCRSLSGRISLPASMQKLGFGAFQGCSSISEVVLPENLTTLHAATFAGCTALESVSVYAAVPPVADATAFAGVKTSGIILFVPQGSETAYAEAPVWKDFKIATLSSVSQAAAVDKVELSIEGSNLWVKHLPQASEVKLFNAQGQLLATARAEGDVSLQLQQHGLYVVTVNGKNFKITH